MPDEIRFFPRGGFAKMLPEKGKRIRIELVGFVEVGGA